MSSTPEAILKGMSRAWRKARRRTAVGEFSGHRAAAEGPRRFEGGSRKNSFNNRGLVTGAAGEVILPENFGAARWGDTDQEGRAAVISHDGILNAVGVEGSEAVGVDGGAVELVAGMVEVVHADLAEVPRMVVVVEHTVVVHASDAIAASGVLSVLPDAGHRRCCRRRRCPLNFIPPFPPRAGVSMMERNEAGGKS